MIKMESYPIPSLNGFLVSKSVVNNSVTRRITLTEYIPQQEPCAQLSGFLLLEPIPGLAYSLFV